MNPFLSARFGTLFCNGLAAWAGRASLKAWVCNGLHNRRSSFLNNTVTSPKRPQRVAACRRLSSGRTCPSKCGRRPRVQAPKQNPNQPSI